jgi:hypothetical protein
MTGRVNIIRAASMSLTRTLNSLVLPHRLETETVNWMRRERETKNKQHKLRRTGTWFLYVEGI